MRVLLVALSGVLCGAQLDLSKAVIVAPDGVAGTVLAEEVQKRSGLRLPIGKEIERNRAAIVITIASGPPEGFRLSIEPPVVSIEASDTRGALYAVGHLLRQMDWAQGRISVPSDLKASTAPSAKIRGHQLGYRSTANSWDAWSIAQFEQYIRELALFGANSIENIPFQDERRDPLMKVDRREMNRAMSEICGRYDLDYWVWTPATVDLRKPDLRAKLLADFEAFFANTPHLAGVFVPGGDPGDNAPELVLPLLADIAQRMQPAHPRAKIWLSLQGFSKEKAEVVYRWLDDGAPSWFGGLVVGPSSPSAAETRHRIPAGVGLRLYPDLTHNKLSQFEVPEWDQAYALTLGREAVNPRPAEYAAHYRRDGPLSDGFLSYSDGVHDDVNKTIWSALAWDPSREVRDILIEYCRLFFAPALAEETADAILALERNWRGPLAVNGAVEATLQLWQSLERRSPQLKDNWRWQMCLLRANYDAYVRRRLIQDTALERETNDILARAAVLGSDKAIAAARATLNRTAVGSDLRQRVIDLCEQLFQSIGLQTSVKKYHASGAERGAVLDFIDHPLNNRWWLEDEFAKVAALPTEQEKVKRLHELARWENPGPGSFYDNVGHVAKSPHVNRCDGEDCDPLFWWWDDGQSRARLSWQVTMWPKAMTYEGLDPRATYVVRTTGYGQALLRIDGERIAPTVDGREMAEHKEFPVPSRHYQDGKLVLTWDRATDEDHLNWRRRSRLAEVWLLRRP